MEKCRYERSLDHVGQFNGRATRAFYGAAGTARHDAAGTIADVSFDQPAVREFCGCSVSEDSGVDWAHSQRAWRPAVHFISVVSEVSIVSGDEQFRKGYTDDADRRTIWKDARAARVCKTDHESQDHRSRDSRDERSRWTHEFNPHQSACDAVTRGTGFCSIRRV